MTKIMAKNMGWQTSRVNKSSLTFPFWLKFQKILPAASNPASSACFCASRKLEAPVTVECSSVMIHHIAFPTTMLHSSSMQIADIKHYNNQNYLPSKCIILMVSLANIGILSIIFKANY